MKQTSRYGIVLLLILTVTFPCLILAQTPPKIGTPQPDQSVKDLINTRRDEHWDFFETQLTLTPPPRSQPVQALPEWHRASSVMLTFDHDYAYSFGLNQLLRTENIGAELLARAPQAVGYVKAILCNTVKSRAGSMLPSQVTRDKPELKGIAETVCQNLSRDNEGLTVAADEPEEGRDAAYLHLKSFQNEVLLDRLSLAHSFLQVVKNLAQYTKVLILVPGSDHAEDDLYERTSLIKEFPEGSALLASGNVQFAQVPVNTKWVRDYGPIFIQGADKRILCVDARYQTNRESLQEKRQFAIMKKAFEPLLKKQSAKEREEQEAEETEEERTRLLDDVSPSLLAERLRERSGALLLPVPISVVRPPIALDGGDFFTDGNGIGFTSTQTLQSNGGNLDLVNQVFREYLGIQEVVYLKPLPGSTVKHIDMFFKVVSPEIILLGTFEEKSKDVYARPLQTEAQRVLAYDLAVLQDFYQSHGFSVNIVRAATDEIKGATGKKDKVVNIVLIPMPEIDRPIRKKLASVVDQGTDLVEKYEQLHESAQKAESESNYLEFSIAYLQDYLEQISKHVNDLGLPATANNVKLGDLNELATDLASTVDNLYDEHGASTKLRNWKNQRFAALSEYLEEKEEDSAGQLKPDERLLLRVVLRKTGDELAAIIFALKQYHSEMQSASVKRNKDVAHVIESLGHVIDQIEQLRKNFPQGSDIYRTYLNALQVRTDHANLLLVPRYNNLTEMEKRVQSIFQRVYAKAYSDVTIIPVDSDYLIQLSGTIHCLTRTIPLELTVFPDDWNYRASSNQP